ncbi:periplasmic heavy metal sensor, partial [Oceanibaculum pacificum]|uniref:periplasmic heavy metal sensor n=1 Tax=Oceanibaculum pacificum TaxID=580166 RepID=UPI0012EDF0C7
MRDFLRRWALPASLIVNLLLLGIIVGGMVSSHKGPPDKDGRRIGFSPLEQAVPEAARAKIAPLLKQERPAIREDFRALREARAEVREALQRTPYDAAAAAAA